MKVTVAATQMACSWDRESNIANAERLIREAAKQGANVILIQELFEAPYFCKDHLAKHFELALPIAENPAIQRLSRVAKELSVVLPLSVFERAHNAYFNTLVMVDADSYRHYLAVLDQPPSGEGFERLMKAPKPWRS